MRKVWLSFFEGGEEKPFEEGLLALSDATKQAAIFALKRKKDIKVFRTPLNEVNKKDVVGKLIVVVSKDGEVTKH